MKFNPQSKEDIQKELLFPAGLYDFTVEDAEDTKSKKGNDMIAIKLRVFGPDDREQIISDWLLHQPAMCKIKFVDFCASVGLADRYNSGEINAHMVDGKSGKVELRVNLNEGTDFAPKNEVGQYVSKAGAKHADAAPARKAKPAIAKEEDDSIPF